MTFESDSRNAESVDWSFPQYFDAVNRLGNGCCLSRCGSLRARGSRDGANYTGSGSR